MPMVLIVMAAAILAGCGTYSGNEPWRRSSCLEIEDAEERANCLEVATRPESEYKQEVEEATRN